jgi:hypothetical protein
MKKANILALATVMMFSSAAFALKAKKKKRYSSSGQSTLQLQDATASEKKNKVDGDIDEEITNARLRAESGSKSKFSLSTSLSYTGGSLAKPFDADRPNLSGEPGNQIKTSADLGLDARYRWSKNDSMTVGTSFSAYTPFQGDTSHGQEKQTNVGDPTIAYYRAGKIGTLFQTNGYLGVGFGTSQESLEIKRTADLGVSYTFLHSFQNGITLGTSVAYGFTFYGDEAGRNPGISEKYIDAVQERFGGYGGDNRVLWSLGVYPTAEYSFNDTFSVRTVFGYFNWKHIYGDNNDFRMLKSYAYQSIGVGISVTRDVYIYPNVQFIPDNIRDDFTNVKVSATINLF